MLREQKSIFSDLYCGRMISGVFIVQHWQTLLVAELTRVQYRNTDRWKCFFALLACVKLCSRSHRSINVIYFFIKARLNHFTLSSFFLFLKASIVINILKILKSIFFISFFVYFFAQIMHKNAHKSKHTISNAETYLYRWITNK